MNSHTQRQWQAKFFRCGMRCHYCYKNLSLLPSEICELATKDHLTPLCRGGADTIDNIVPACFACNRKKAEMTEAEFRGALSTAFKIAQYDVPSGKKGLELQNEPTLLRRLLSERDGNVSWAWRNPV
jgi:5-methylcytosine-specific restriction endonuclease McrA